jgi:PHP family Zn ribbon phosphoesterase
MVTLQNITAVPNGAQFLNADLHVHSYGASSDVKDPTMTVKAIIDAAIAQRISVLAITDHNSDANLADAIEYAQQFTGQILVLPGVEISTAHGHLLVYFPPDRPSQVRTLLGKIDLVGDLGAPDTHTAMSMANVIREAERLGGICIAAHIDRPKTGFEMLADGYPNWKKDILTSSGLYGLEIDESTHLVWYSW